nr:hypothetical protein CFP56_51755 [Quercus suber]
MLGCTSVAADAASSSALAATLCGKLSCTGSSNARIVALCGMLGCTSVAADAASSGALAATLCGKLSYTGAAADDA